MVKIPVYIGVEPHQWLSGELLRYSLLKRTRAQLEFHELLPVEMSLPLPFGAGFSFYRWYIPHLRKYQGRALYLTVNNLVLDDIEIFFNQTMPKPALAAPVTNPPSAKGFQTNVLLLDCERLTHWKPLEWVHLCQKDPEMVSKIMWGLPEAPNCPDLGPLDPSLPLIDSSPEAFQKELKAALEDEAIPLPLIAREIQLGHLPNTLLNL